MNVQSLFQNFNPGKFIVHVCLLLFVIFFSLRLDGTITWNYWLVFAPIWFWKFMVVIGATIGIYVWFRYPHYRLEGDAYIQYKSLLMTLFLHLMLLMFELLACDRLQWDTVNYQSNNKHYWILIFTPLIFISIISIAVCIWAVKHDRSFELELFCAVNLLQFIFLAMKLDKFTSWSWEIVFIPLWVIMCLSLVTVLYTIIFAGIVFKSPDVNQHQRRNSLNNALAYTFLVIPIIVFQVMLTNKLDNNIDFSYLEVISPLLLSFTTLITMSFNSKGGNKWWFGLRKDFSQCLLSICPFLQEYANIAYNLDNNPVSDQGINDPPVVAFEFDDPTLSSLIRNAKKNRKSKTGNHWFIVNEPLPKTVMPIVSIDKPD